MSQKALVSRKEKKALRDAERHGKTKKRKRAEVEDHSAENVQATTPDKAVDRDNSTGDAAQKSRKRKADNAIDADLATAAAVTEPAAKPKRRKKGSSDASADDQAVKDAPTKPSKNRFIVFVGNLPFNTTDGALRAHFKKLEPFTVRHRTDPKTKKSKGFAFMEFENYDRMKTCLKLYHHTMFDPDDFTGAEEIANAGKGVDENRVKKKDSKKARKINVELTAGGGGKTEVRKVKIKAKNAKLEDERKRRAEAEKKEREKKEQEAVKKAGQTGKGEGKLASTGVELKESNSIHPSRLARMKDG